MTCSDGFYDSLQSSLYPIGIIAMTRSDYPNELFELSQ